MGGLFDLFIMLASLIWPWGGRVGCWGLVGAPRGSLPPETLPPKNGPLNTRIQATYAYLWVSNAYGSPQTCV
eukprot:1146719-Pelagomonas_calceolata.AAC.1